MGALFIVALSARNSVSIYHVGATNGTKTSEFIETLSTPLSRSLSFGVHEDSAMLVLMASAISPMSVNVFERNISGGAWGTAQTLTFSPSLGRNERLRPLLVGDKIIVTTGGNTFTTNAIYIFERQATGIYLVSQVIDENLFNAVPFGNGFAGVNSQNELVWFEPDTDGNLTLTDALPLPFDPEEDTRFISGGGNFLAFAVNLETNFSLPDSYVAYVIDARNFTAAPTVVDVKGCGTFADGILMAGNTLAVATKLQDNSTDTWTLFDLADLQPDVDEVTIIGQTGQLLPPGGRLTPTYFAGTEEGLISGRAEDGQPITLTAIFYVK